jgi:inorganic pyrophosphatase
VPGKPRPPLTELRCREAESGDLRVVVETPRRSPNKYRYEPECGTLMLASMLPEGMSFPYDFGFIPSTLGDDGDPLDVLLLMDEPAIPLSIVRARLIGAIRAEQKDQGGEWEENDRLVAVACHAHGHADEKSLKSLRPHLIDEIIAFFTEYNRQHGKQFRSTGLCGPRKAGRIVDAGEKRFRRKAK